MSPGTIDVLIQFGALGIVAYFVFWLTHKFNGSVKENTKAINRNTTSVDKVVIRDMQIHDMLEKRTERFEAIEDSILELQRSSEGGFRDVVDAIHESDKKLLQRLWALVKQETLKGDE